MLEYNKPLEIKGTDGEVKYTIANLSLDFEFELDLILLEFENIMDRIATEYKVKKEEVKLYQVILNMEKSRIKEIYNLLQKNIKGIETMGIIDTVIQAYIIGHEVLSYKSELKKK